MVFQTYSETDIEVHRSYRDVYQRTYTAYIVRSKAFERDRFLRDASTQRPATAKNIYSWSIFVHKRSKYKIKLRFQPSIYVFNTLE